MALPAQKTIFFDVDDTLYDRDAAQHGVALAIARRFPDIFSELPETQIIEAFLESDRMTEDPFYASEPGQFDRCLRQRLFQQLPRFF
jgi:FMN phosphatase YigB (HAD superfamily)